VTAFGGIDVLFAHNGGTITGTGPLELTVTGNDEFHVVHADGTGSPPGSTAITMTTGQTVIDLTQLGPANANARAVHADFGAKVTINDFIITEVPSPVSPKGITRGVEAGDFVESNGQPVGSILDATDTHINMGPRAVGAFAWNSANLSLTNCVITITDPNALGWGTSAQNASTSPTSTILTATDTTVTVTGNNKTAVSSYFGGATTAGGATTILNHCIVSASGNNTDALEAINGEIDIRKNSTVTGTLGALVTNGGVLDVGENSTIQGDIDGVEITDFSVYPGSGSPNTVTLTSSKLTNLSGAAFNVEGAVANIFVTNSTVDSGVGATQHTLLDATQIVPGAAKQVPSPAPNVTPAAVTPKPSLVNLTSSSSTLNGDILVDASSTANVKLEHNSVLTGAANEHQLTGATGINPSPVVNPLIFPAPPPPPFTVNLDIDSTSRWTMRASSTLNNLTVNPRASINFADPPADPFKTLLVNNLSGTGGIFKLNNDLAAIKGDLIEILAKSEGRHLLTFNNRTAGSDLPVNTALLVVRTSDGGAGFTGQEDGGTFRYFVVHGDGSSVTPVRNDWYLVRGDEINPPQTTPPPPTNPNPPGPVAPGDNLPLPPEPPPRRLSRIDDLTNTANAVIGTYSSTIPLFYADMQTLVERMGELRLGIVTAPAPAPVPPTTKEGGKGVVEPKEIVAPPPPRSEWAVWIRGFGNGMRINNDVSRRFDQDVGGFQIGADKRFGSLWSGDVYLGVFGGYMGASRDFRDGGDGTSNALSFGGYATWIHPQGWYLDIVGKYTHMWNHFSTPTLVGSVSTGDYNISTVGGSIEVGKRFDFADHRFFIEPQAQLAGVWEDGMDYTASNGLRVHGDHQTSLQGRLGGRVGMHFDFSQSCALEPYAKAEAIQEFLTGNTVRTNSTNFDSHLSGTVGRFGAGLTAKVSQSVYLYGEYDYATGDHIQAPWAVDAGLRWQW
jgi:outer membrane autotransporter protein